jgi:Peptidase family M48
VTDRPPHEADTADGVPATAGAAGEAGAAADAADAAGDEVAGGVGGPRRGGRGLPSGTFAAFVLLIGVALAAAVGFHPALFDVVSVQGPSTAAGYERCIQAEFPAPGHTVTPAQVARACAGTQGDQDLRPGILLCFGTMLLLTAIQYVAGPAWRIRCRRLRPVDQAMLPEMAAELELLRERALGDGHVEFLIDIVNPAVDGLAFGRRKHPNVALSRGMVALFDRDRPAFRAIVLHELAHVRNRDLGVTAVTLALWRSFVIVVMVPGTLAALGGTLVGHPPGEFGEQIPFVSGAATAWVYAGQLAGLAGLAWLTRYTVLRSRELAADARALTWQPDPGPLRELFAVQERRRPLIGRLTGLRRRTHPHLRVRRAALTEPDRLLRLEFGFGLVLGTCFSLDLDPAVSATGQLRTNPLYWPVTPFVLVLTAVLWLAMFRAAGLSGVSGGVRARLGLAVGLPLGALLAPSFITDHSLAPYPVAVQLTSLLLLALAGWLFGTWTQWVVAAAKRTPPDTARRGWAIFLSALLVAGVATLCVKAVYELRTWAFIASLTHYPAVSNPVELVAASAQLVLDTYPLTYGYWLPVCLALLLAAPLLIGLLARRDTTRPPAPVARRQRALVFWTAIGWAVVAALLAEAAANILNVALFGPGGSQFADLVNWCAGVGAAVGAAVAALARSAPVLASVVSGLACGVVYLGGARTWFPAIGSLGWSDWAFGLTQVLEAALLAALLTSAFRVLRRRGRTPNLDLSGTTPDGRDRQPRPR